MRAGSRSRTEAWFGMTLSRHRRLRQCPCAAIRIPPARGSGASSKSGPVQRFSSAPESCPLPSPPCQFGGKSPSSGDLSSAASRRKLRPAHRFPPNIDLGSKTIPRAGTRQLHRYKAPGGRLAFRFFFLRSVGRSCLGPSRPKSGSVTVLRAAQVCSPDFG